MASLGGGRVQNGAGASGRGGPRTYGRCSARGRTCACPGCTLCRASSERFGSAAKAALAQRRSADAPLVPAVVRDCCRTHPLGALRLRTLLRRPVWGVWRLEARPHYQWGRRARRERELRIHCAKPRSAAASMCGWVGMILLPRPTGLLYLDGRDVLGKRRLSEGNSDELTRHGLDGLRRSRSVPSTAWSDKRCG